MTDDGLDPESPAYDWLGPCITGLNLAVPVAYNTLTLPHIVFTVWGVRPFISVIHIYLPLPEERHLLYPGDKVAPPAAAPEKHA